MDLCISVSMYLWLCFYQSTYLSIYLSIYARRRCRFLTNTRAATLRPLQWLTGNKVARSGCKNLSKVRLQNQGLKTGSFAVTHGRTPIVCHSYAHHLQNHGFDKHQRHWKVLVTSGSGTSAPVMLRQKSKKITIENVYFALAPRLTVLLGFCALSSVVSLASGWLVDARFCCFLAASLMWLLDVSCWVRLEKVFGYVWVNFRGALRIGTEIWKFGDWKFLCREYVVLEEALDVSPRNKQK